MSLETRLTTAMTTIAASINTAKSERGTLASLSTTNKANLVAAINEVKVIADAAAGGGVAINDAVTNATDAWSSNKIAAEISAAIAALVNAAPGTLDTLAELATAIQGNDTDIATILTEQADRVAVTTQTFTGPQQTQARANIDAQDATSVGNTDRDFAADFTGALT